MPERAVRLAGTTPMPTLLLAGVVLLAIACGAAMPFYAELMDGSVSRMAVLPALAALGILLVYDRKVLMILIISLRASGDVFFDATRISLGGAQIGIGGVVNAFVILLAVLLVAETPKKLPALALRAWAPFLALALYGALSSPVRADAIRLWLSCVSNWAVFVSAFYLISQRAEVDKCLRLVVWSSAFPVCYALGDLVLHAGQVGTDLYRLQSTFAHPNIFAFYLTTIIVVMFYLHKTPAPAPARARTVAVNLFMAGYLLLLLALLLMTKTRNAWIATALWFFAYGVLFQRRYLLYLLAAPLLAMLVPGIAERLADLGQGNEVITYARLNSFAWRLYAWRSALGWMEPMHYLLGYGLLSFLEYSTIFFPLANTTGSGAHNVYVQLLFELGVAGLCSYVWLYWGVARTLVGLVKGAPLLAFCILGILVQYLLSSCADNMLAYLSFNWYLWFVLGAGCALATSTNPIKKLSTKLSTKPGTKVSTNADIGAGAAGKHVRSASGAAAAASFGSGRRA
jgi:O-antigen ligase